MQEGSRGGGVRWLIDLAAARLRTMVRIDGRGSAASPGSRRAILSLEGLALGDAFGEAFFVGNDVAAAAQVERRELPSGTWRWTDDTAMAIPVVEELLRTGTIEPGRLATAFARRYTADPARGYGAGTHVVLGAIAAGTPWSTANRLGFADGSKGNGAAMRSAPIGAYFAGRTDWTVDAARASAVPTHAHPDAVAGAVAVALGAGYAAGAAGGHRRGALLAHVASLTPDGPVRDGLVRAQALLDATPGRAADVLGSGNRVLAEDTVPFALWCADRHLDSAEEALWATVAGLGDRDTTCAIVGGIVALSSATDLPRSWLARRESLPDLAV